ncbi:MAG: general secretion pathway protein A [Halioglobus sp.]|jgi:general secretion pathway protein A
MYEVFYNLNAEPFRLSPDHKFCYEHNGYAKARAYMAYAYRRAEGFVMITGRPGTGKTTLIGELVESLASDNVATANLVCTQLEADDLLKTVAYSFGIGSGKADKAELLQRLTVLLNRWHREGRRALLIVDEAQDLSISAMEELRLLTNIQVGGQPLLQIFMLGQPELRDLVMSPEMEQVHQRIVAASHLNGLESDETEAYVVHRLLAVGWDGDPALDRAIFPLIHKFSEGVPRRINLICSRLFLLGCVEERHAIEVADVRVVISELQAENLAAGSWYSEADFDTTGEPDWVIPPSGNEEQPERAEVQLRAVNIEPLAPLDDVAYDEAVVDPKKKEAPLVATIYPAQATSEDLVGYIEPASTADSDSISVTELEVEAESTDLDAGYVVPDPVAAFEGATAGDSDPESLLADDTDPEGQSDSQGEPFEIPALAVMPAADDVAAESESFAVRPFAAASAMSRKPAVSPAPKRYWRRAVIFGTVLILMVSLVFFLEIFMPRNDDQAYQDSDLSSLDSSLPESRGEIVKPVESSEPDYSMRDDDLAAEVSSEMAALASAQSIGSSEVTATDVDYKNDSSMNLSVLNERATAGAGTGTENDVLEVDPVVTDVEFTPIEGTVAPSQNISADVSLANLSAVASQREPLSLAAVPEQIFRVNFSFDSANLIPGSQSVLDRAAEKMHEKADTVASIAGFTDSQGEEAYNLVLSRQRAVAVEQYLVGAGIDLGRLTVEARGVSASASEERSAWTAKSDREQHRAVQITISREQSN